MNNQAIKFYVIISRKKDIGSFRKAKWKIADLWVYEKLGEALIIRDGKRAGDTTREFDVLHCNARIGD